MLMQFCCCFHYPRIEFDLTKQPLLCTYTTLFVMGYTDKNNIIRFIRIKWKNTYKLSNKIKGYAASMIFSISLVTIELSCYFITLLLPCG